MLINKTLAQFAVTDDALRIFEGPVPFGYVCSFLASRFGHVLMTRGAYRATVSHLEAKHLAQLPVPMASGQLQGHIHDLIVEAYRLRDLANEDLEKADELLLKTLGLDAFDERAVEYLGALEKPKAFEITSSEIFARFDAAHHVPLARSAVHKLAGGKFNLVALKRMAEIYLAPRFARICVERAHGVPLLQSSHVPISRLSDLKYISLSQTGRLERWIDHISRNGAHYVLRHHWAHCGLNYTDGWLGRITTYLTG